MSIAEKINKIVNPEWSGTAVHEGTRTAESVLGEISAQLSRALGGNFSIFLHPGR